MKHLISLLLNGLAVYFAALVLNVLFPSILPVYVQSYPVAIVVSIVFALVNMLIRPVLKLITLPINVITLGLFGLVVNGICVLIVPLIVNLFVPGGFVIHGILWAIVYGALVSFTQSTLAVLVK
ncbi:phage holin family protein [Candidatus Woesebacteria bacterium]|nr:phage holin family protein [Candidatus Woesebacteria bacterium]